MSIKHLAMGTAIMAAVLITFPWGWLALVAGMLAWVAVDGMRN